MTPSPILGAFVGALIMSGFLLIALGTRSGPNRRHDSNDPTEANETPKIPFSTNLRVLAVSSAGGLAVGVTTGWWSITVLGCLGGLLIPAMCAERQAQIADRRRVSAVASWVETVRDLLSAASGIDEAIIRSAQTLPPKSPIKAEVETLAATATLGGLRNGLKRFGAAMADPTVDYVTATLMIASERSSGVLHEQLSEAASVAREQVSVRERVDASRSRVRTASTAIVVVTVVMVVFIIGTQPSYATWYGQLTGQVVLTIAGCVELIGVWWLARIARPEQGTRITLDFDTATLRGGYV
jgi:tight adherence protein B